MDNFDQLNSLLAPILNDPQAMAGIAQAAAQMGLGDVPGSSAGTDSKTDGQAAAEKSTGGGDDSGDIISMLGRITPLLRGNDDDTARLLAALRPFLHGERAKRLDDAQRILKLLRIAEALRGQGLI